MDHNATNRLSSKELEDRFDLLATESKEYALFLVNLEGQLISWNTGAERFFGYQSNEVIGTHLSRFYTPEDILTGQPEHELETAPGGARTAFAGRSARTAGGSGVKPL
jgi:PAS domain S-box-containing protein